MASKKCTKCGELKLTRYFSARNQVSKKTGVKLYLSHCKKCRTKHSEETRKRYLESKRLYHRELCPIEGCDNTKTKNAKVCSYCKGQLISGKKIDEKWLVRGKISTNSRESSMTQEA